MATATLTPDRQHYRAVLADLAAKAKETLGEAMHKRIDCAVGLVLRGDVMLQEDGTALVGSRTEPRKTYVVNGVCACKDFDHAPAEGWCSHRIARALAIRLARELPPVPKPEPIPEPPPVEPWPDNDFEDPTPAPEPLPEETVPAHVKPEWIQMIHGKAFIRYVGLLALAHEQGLQKLEARFVSLTETLAVAAATATFADGRVFTEAAESTPTNVGPQVKDHFARIALTRAKARALRDALNLGMCSVEELA